MDEFNAIRTLALRNVIKADNEEYLLRKIFRSYSKTFSTPLHIVETLPLDDVFLHFFEDLFENMEKKDLEDERLDVIETDEEIVARQKAEDREDVELYEIAKETIEQEKVDLATIKLPTEQSRFKDAVKGFSKDVEMINNSLKEIREAPSGIKMIFDDNWDESDFEKDSFGLLDDPKLKKA